nr:immunoglobulin light chain junction region [Macaca mulatta]
DYYCGGWYSSLSAVLF